MFNVLLPGAMLFVQGIALGFTLQKHVAIIFIVAQIFLGALQLHNLAFGGHIMRERYAFEEVIGVLDSLQTALEEHRAKEAKKPKKEAKK